MCGFGGRGISDAFSAVFASFPRRNVAGFSHLARACLILASLFLSVGAVWAEPVDADQARRAAAAYIARNYAPVAVAAATGRLAAPSTLAVSAVRPLKGKTGVIGYVAELAPSGFAVVRADNDLPPLKLHSSGGAYEGLPAGVRAVIEAELAGELADADRLRASEAGLRTEYRAEWESLSRTAAVMSTDLSLVSAGTETLAAAGTVLLSTAWNQIAPYNYYAPAASGGSGGKASVGCGPVAMAQILRYHKQPARPLSDKTYTDDQGSCRGTYSLSDAGGLGDYAWDRMPATLTASSSLEEIQAAGRLLFHCAVAMEADFEASYASVISYFVAARMLRETFGYTCDDYQSRAGFSTAVWFAKIQSDIDANRPIYYTMVSSLGGHAAVCDGYRNGNEIHLNFGLGGYGDAWYNIDSIVFPTYKWTSHEAVFGIAPDDTPALRTLTVVGGTGSGSYLAGTEVVVAADEPPEGQFFSKWSVAPADSDLGVGFAATQRVTTIVMPNHSTTLTAVFKPVNVNRAKQTITFGALPTKVLGDDDFAPGATASSGLAVVYASSDETVAQIVDGLVHIVGAGSAVITASQPGNVDFAPAAPVSRTLTVKVRLTVEIPDGGGTVSGGGLYAPGAKVRLSARPASGYTLLRWEDGSQVASRTLVMPASNVTARAWFGLKASVPPPAVGAVGPQRAMAGVFYTLPLDIQSESLPSVKVSGLPAGLRYNASAGRIEGAPAAPAEKSVTVSAKNVNVTNAVMTFTLTIEPLPGWAQGSFSGACRLGAIEAGVAEMTVSAQGKITGRVSYRGTNYSFGANSYTNGGGFVFATEAVAGKTRLPLTVSVAQPAPDPAAPAGLGVAEGELSCGQAGTLAFTLYRHLWKDNGMIGAAAEYAGYYTAILPCGLEAGAGYLTLTVSQNGTVKAAGKLADGTKLSLSATLLADETGRVLAVLYSAPAAYKGGAFFAAIEFAVSDTGDRPLLPVGTLRWANLNPQATGDYGAGFDRELSLSGGWYDTTANLYRYYADAELFVDGEASVTPAIMVGTNRYESVWWTPYGIALTPATNRTGVLSGFSAPQAEAPAPKEGGYDYAGTANAVSLRMNLTRATGLFKGTFKAWFDYGTTHTSRTLSYEGVLVPGRADTEDTVEGGGFFLWADKGSYVNPSGKRASYTFNWSYSFLLSAGQTAE